MNPNEPNPGSPRFQARLQMQGGEKSLLGRIVTLILGAIFLVLAFMFSIVALAVVAIGGLGLAGWFWWKTRALRKAMRAQQAAGAGFGSGRPGAAQEPVGGVIEGECIRENPVDTQAGRHQETWQPAPVQPETDHPGKPPRLN